MANRRKFLAGLGALASGSAAAVGTGAFSSVSATRTVSVNVASDESSFLALNATDERASITDGQLELEFDNSGEGALGLNPNSRTAFLDVFEITNQGDDPAYVGVGVEQSDVYADGAGNPLLADYENLSMFVYAEDSNGNGPGLSFNGGNGNMEIDSGGRVDADFDSNGTSVPEDNPRILSPGDSISVDFSFIVDGNSLGTGGNDEIVVAAADPNATGRDPDDN
ncbi:hypothetical protein [Halorubrum tebenquichense]|uniref:DUF1102 domain-containing protein n=1 Tax=Halorubrum tebenquichense DSM 14210 TaxID=1227485 RepID=M0DJV2_9EURY|nr:hypothetical protein [Halorubrum tebenquichense]ELZ35781.1 hypothetical protein C472_11069 [Halorubrum tebenquichense DSM 14210]